MPIVKRLTLCLAGAFCSLTSLSPAGTPAGASPTCCPIVEMRQYTTLPGKRDALIQLYEDQFIESQEAAGIELPGQFRVVGFPNRFTWLQGFQSMPDRKTDFEAFYGGSIWKSHRKEVNALLLENGNVILLHPAHEGSGFPAPPARPPLGSTAEPSGLIVATTYYLNSTTGAQFDTMFETTMRPVITAHGATIIASFATDHSPNNFPILPVRTDVNLFVWFACFANKDAYDRYADALSNDPQWWSVEGNFALAGMYVPPEVALLQPTPRSLLRCTQ